MTNMKKRRTFKQERTRIYEEKRIDPYRERQKLPEPTVCTGCGAIFTRGRWSWDDISEIDNLNEAVCPACRRTSDNYPAGFVELSGDFFMDHYREIMNLVTNTGKRELKEHPLERIMKITTEDGVTRVATTGMHLARRIGDALVNSYEGKMDYNYEAEYFIRVKWHR